jgi:nucleotide-binding universal stress UspA family protein
MKILIATDGSKYSNKAIDYGIGLAARTGAEVAGLYVINMKTLEFFALGHHDNISGYEKENTRLLREGEEALAYLKEQCTKAGVKVSTAVVRGYPAEEIMKTAETEKVAMIVVGNVGRTGLDHMLMGSVSETVVRKAPCPVLVVRGEARLD